MADTEVAAPATIEINDAYFCQHFKEVVSTQPPHETPGNDLNAPRCSARPASTTDGKRTTRSLGYVILVR